MRWLWLCLCAYFHSTAVVVITVFISSSSSIIIIITITSSLFPQMTPRVYSLFKHTWSYPNRIFSSILHQGSWTLPLGREVHGSQEENPAAFSLWGAVGNSCWRKLRWGPSLKSLVLQHTLQHPCFLLWSCSPGICLHKSLLRHLQMSPLMLSLGISPLLWSATAHLATWMWTSLPLFKAHDGRLRKNGAFLVHYFFHSLTRLRMGVPIAQKLYLFWGT